MKNLLFSLILSGWSVLAFGQEINYKITYDNPDFQPFLNLNVSYFDVDVPVSSIDAINFNAGVWGFFEPIKGLGADFRFRRSYLTMAQLAYNSPPSFSNFELGGYFRIGGYLKKKPTAVVLDVEWDTDQWDGPKRTFAMKSMAIQALNKRDYLVRAGFYHVGSPLSTDEVTDANDQNIFADGLGQASVNGLYAGIAMRTFKNVFIETEQFGDQGTSMGRTLYFDAIFAGTTISDPYEDPSTGLSFDEEAAKEAIGSLPLGFRVGLSTYQIEKKARTGKKFGMSTNYEAGYRPYIGWYISGGLGFTLVKWNK